MAKNDTLLIDGILDDRIAQKLPSDKRDEAFEYFAFEQIPFSLFGTRITCTHYNINLDV